MKFHLSILASLLFACNSSHQSTKAHTPKGTSINASGYSRIISDIGADIYIEMNADSPYHCYLQCEKALEPLIAFDIVNDELHISTIDNATANSLHPVVIYMRVRELKSIRSNGSGKIVINGDLKSEKFNIDNDGSSTISVNNVMNTELCINCSGSGDVTVNGKTKSLITKIRGSGNVKAFGLMAETADAAIAGSGNMETHVASTLDADIGGSGNIYYKGKPSIRNSITGSGLVTAR